MTTPPARLAWVDALRVVDALLVVLVHADYLARPDAFTWWPAGIYSILLYGACVPLFFALAGYVGARSRPRDLVRRAARLVPLLVAHGIVLLVVGVREEPTLAGQLVSLAMGVWYLYFVSALVQLLLAHALVERFFARGRGFVLAVALLATLATYAATSARLWLHGSDMGALEAQVRSLGTTWAAYYALGVYAGRCDSARAAVVRRAWAVALFAALASIPFLREAFAEDARYGHATTLQLLVSGLPFQILTTAASMALAAGGAAHPKVARVFAFVARGAPATLSIYLLHGTALWILYRAWMRSVAVVHPLEVPVLALLAVTCSLAVRFGVRGLPRPLPWVLAGVAQRR